MYNTNFNVKYHDIRVELLNKLNNHEKQLKENKNMDEIDYKYNEEDIDIICDKLYKDELISVFYADSVFDDKIDISMRKIFDKIMLEDSFKQFVLDIKNKLININEYSYELETYYIIFISLFKQELFYLSHKLISNFINNQTIDLDLLVIIKNKTLELFK
jgi:hypothetical protein